MANTTRTELERVLSRLDARPGSPEPSTALDSEALRRSRQPRGFDVGRLPAVPMPYMVFPECQDTVAVLRSREEIVSATHLASICKSERLRRHALTVTRGHGSPSRGCPYAPLGVVADLDQPAASRTSPLRIVYPMDTVPSEEEERRVGRPGAHSAREGWRLAGT